MVLQYFIGTILLVASVLFQALCFDLIIKNVRRIEKFAKQRVAGLRKAMTLSAFVLAVSCVLIAEIWVWALVYLGIGALDGLEQALYFSTASFTTVGYGALVLTEKWRLLGSVEALNGFLLFGWSVAFVFEAVSKIYTKEGHDIELKS